jgi:DAK2 domain fusion protein YloV
MKRAVTLSGSELRSMLIAGTGWLEKIVVDINALNVYPVPDGDCGTNMLFTMRASLAEAARLTDNASISAVAEAIARGALMGARGNSGVILSQIWRGLFEGLKSRETVDIYDLAQALKEASVVAYQALSNPVEGTILTVMRDAASAAGKEASNTRASLVSVMKAVVDAAKASVINTPNLLQVLKDAGVVDAGGHGLFTLFEGALLHLKGNTDSRSPELLTVGLPLATQQSSRFLSSEEDSYGFCTQFMVEGENLDLAELKSSLEGMGNSVIVVGDKKAIRVHIHTQNPDEVTKVASSYGKLVDIDINDMDEQHIEFLILHQEKMPRFGTAIIAVVNGDGMINAFSDLGVSAIIPGGQTMNPSTMDILQTVEKVTANNVILLPNNKNVIPTANLIQPLTKKNLKIIPTETIPQGISALIAFVPEDDFESNVEEMTEAMTKVRTIEITYATRTTMINNINIKKGEIIGLLDNELLVAGNNSEDCIFQLLEQVDIKDAGIVTIYYGKDAEETKARKISSGITKLYPGLEVGVVNGGQPYYDYIISVE